MRHCAVIFFAMLIVFSCSSPPAPGKNKEKTIRINLGTEPPSLDPRKLFDNISAYVATMCFDSLTREDAEGNIQLSLATSYELSEDQTRYTFKIRPSVWSNGQPITAYDFEKSWKSCLEPDFPCPAALVFYYIKNAKLAKEGKVSTEEVGVKALDKETLQIDLIYPQPHFLQILSSRSYYPYPEGIAENNLSFLENSKTPFVSLGPFYIESYKAHDKMILKKNPFYWDKDAVKLDKIDLFFIADQTTELSMYEQGEIDWVGSPVSSLPSDALNQLKKRKDFHSYPISGLYYYVFNVEEFPLNNTNIRKALTLAIHRKELIEHILQTDFESATRLIPTIAKPLEGPSFQDGDLVKAQMYFKKGCEELNLSVDTFPVISLSYNAGVSLHYKIAQAIQQQWRKYLGVSSTLETQEWKVYLDTMAHHRFQVARMGIVSLCSDPSFFLELFAYKNSPTNQTGWYHEDFENLFLKTSQTLDKKERLRIIQEAEELFLEEMPIAPLFFYTNSYLKKESIKNVVLGELNNLDLKWADIE